MARAKPSGIWGGHGHLPVVGASGVVSSGGAAGPTGVVNGHGAVGPNGIPNAIGHAGIGIGIGGVGIGAAALGLGGVGVLDDGDDGQWHGEGLLASQDLSAHRAVIAPGVGIVGAHGLGIGLGLGLGHGHW